MIDPMISLASSMSASPGVYALLLGSGLSRAAGIPTGWEVTVDLIRRLDATEGEAEVAKATEDEVTTWYRDRYDDEPSYSDILGLLGAGGADRQNLLRSYFEPTEEEREEGEKTPTRAHKAIAELAAEGYIKVVLTTNFDRLLEDALTASGVRYQVIANADGIEGATPLSNAPFTIIKLHGDYRDTRIKNTVAELETYEPEMVQYLSRVLEEHGLVVSGWSGEWDIALITALKIAVSRRYGFYWITRSGLSETAKELVDHREGRVIQTESADAFFPNLAERISSIERLGGQDPLSAELAEIALKRYLPRAERRVDLDELVRTHIEDLRERHSRWQGSGRNLQTYMEELEELAAMTETCMRLVVAGAYHGEDHHDHLWTLMIDRALNHPHLTGMTSPEIHRLPATLLVYGMTAGALAADQMGRIPRVLDSVSLRASTDLTKAGYHAFRYYDSLHEGVLGKVYRPGPNRQYRYPESRWIRVAASPYLRPLVPAGYETQRLLDEVEYVIALLTSIRPEYENFPGRAPMGHFFRDFPWHEDLWKGGDHVVARYQRRLDQEGDEFPLVEWGGVSLEEFRAAKEKVDQQTQEASRR